METAGRTTRAKVGVRYSGQFLGSVRPSRIFYLHFPNSHCKSLNRMGWGQGGNWVQFLWEADTQMEVIDLRFSSQIGLGCVLYGWKARSEGYDSEYWPIATSVTTKGCDSLISNHPGLVSYTHLIYMFQPCMLANNNIIIIMMLVIMIMKEGGRQNMTKKRVQVTPPPFLHSSFPDCMWHGRQEPNIASVESGFY